MKNSKKSGGMFVLDVGQKHKHISIVLVSDVLPLGDNHHNFLDKLSVWSDIVYIFPEVTFSGYNDINRKKFVSLYNGLAWTEVNKERSLVDCLLFSLSYILNIFSNYSGVSIIRLDSIEEKTTDKLLGNLQKVYASEVIQPVFKIQRQDSASLFYLYSVLVKEKLGNKLFRDIWCDKETDNLGMYTRYSTFDPVIFLRPITIKDILNYTDSNPDYISSFSYLDPNTLFEFMASVVKEIGITNLNASIETLDINKL